ncbi:alpha/beta hydrolase [Paraconexibacter algicola]|uniref:Acetyl hydrolase n=1 Tax=Paraconexibacter algicola TaxID=2133960 RepID=A0A2T4UC37_9ACTN|nr:alpha/beta hydrolase [Paraconexibacter algicola]PTL54774.1 acetyl hydrolase [Paraconexibacter algicola]
MSAGPGGGLHPQVAALVTAPTDGPLDLDTLRAGYAETARALGGPPEDVAHVQNLRVPRQDGPDTEGIPARYYLPQDLADGPAGVLVWFHGGGWVMGDLAGIDPACRAICAASGHAVLSIDYRLAPEHPFPAGLDDAWSAVRWAAGPDGAEMLAIEEGRVAVGGDSAGGNLAAACARRARDGGLALHGQVLVYPALDPTGASPSFTEHADSDMLRADQMRWFLDAYAGGDAGARLRDPDFAPLAAASFADLAPAYVAVAEIDPLRDDGLRYAQRLQEAGVEASTRVHAGMAHGFLRWGGAVDEALVLLEDLGRETRRLLG